MGGFAYSVLGPFREWIWNYLHWLIIMQHQASLHQGRPPPNHSKVSGMRTGIKIGAIGDNVGPRCHGAAGGGGVGKRTMAVLLCESARNSARH